MLRLPLGPGRKKAWLPQSKPRNAEIKSLPPLCMHHAKFCGLLSVITAGAYARVAACLFLPESPEHMVLVCRFMLHSGNASGGSLDVEK